MNIIIYILPLHDMHTWSLNSLQSLLDGKLYGRVQSFTNGSIWEMVKEDGKLVGFLPRNTLWCIQL